MNNEQSAPARLRWARLRFAIVGPLLAAPPERGDLVQKLDQLAKQSWQHPTTGEQVRFGVSTLERWFYVARNEPSDPVMALERKVPSNAGQRRSINEALRHAIRLQYQEHPAWSCQLHYDNLGALAEKDPSLKPLPSYNTLGRYMKEQGMIRHRRQRRRGADKDQPQSEQISEQLVTLRERRSFEVRHVSALWHADFHVGSRKVLTPSGDWKSPVLLGFLDDRSRLCCHVQWYLAETAEVFVHGLIQAIQKRGLPRALLTDNGSAMEAAETQEGLERLSIVHWTTLPYSPEQNAKQEVFWAQVEGRLMAMFEGYKELTLPLLNEGTQAWVELEYNRTNHREIGQPPLERFLAGPDLARPSPSSEDLRRAFRVEQHRKQRMSDGTITVEGKRFELPTRYRTLPNPTVRFARWDLSTIDLVDPRTGKHLCVLLPLDKEKNADGRRHAVAPTVAEVTPPVASGVAPLLKKLMSDYAATGLPPAYVPLDNTSDVTAEPNDNVESPAATSVPEQTP